MADSIYQCRRGHIQTDEVKNLPFVLKLSFPICSECFEEWLKEEFGLCMVADPAILAAYRFGGLQAAQEVAQSVKKDGELDAAEVALKALGGDLSKEERERMREALKVIK